jgi:hypothetical protein
VRRAQNHPTRQYADVNAKVLARKFMEINGIVAAQGIADARPDGVFDDEEEKSLAAKGPNSTKGLIRQGLLRSQVVEWQIVAFPEMQIACGQRIAWVEVVVDCFAISELCDCPILREHPIGHCGSLATKREFVAADEPAWKEKLAGRGNIPRGANPKQFRVGTITVVDPSMGDDWRPKPRRTRYNCYPNNRAVFTPDECKRSRFAGGFPLVFAGNFSPLMVR